MAEQEEQEEQAKEEEQEKQEKQAEEKTQEKQELATRWARRLLTVRRCEPLEPTSPSERDPRLPHESPPEDRSNRLALKESCANRGSVRTLPAGEEHDPDTNRSDAHLFGGATTINISLGALASRVMAHERHMAPHRRDDPLQSTLPAWHLFGITRHRRDDPLPVRHGGSGRPSL